MYIMEQTEHCNYCHRDTYLFVKNYPVFGYTMIQLAICPLCLYLVRARVKVIHISTQLDERDDDYYRLLEAQVNEDRRANPLA